MDQKIYPCPFGGKTCINGKREDFGKHPVTKERLTCPKWNFIRITDPRTGEIVDRWDCYEAIRILIDVKAVQATEQNTASTDKVATNVSKVNNTFIAALPGPAQERLIEKIKEIGAIENAQTEK